MSSYITTTDIVEYGYQVEEDDEVLLDKIGLRASRIFDRFAEVPPSFFDKAPSESANRVVYGTGTDYLFLPPYIAPLGANAISMPTGYTVPEFYERQSRFGLQYLQRKYSGQSLSLMEPDGWPLWGAPERVGWLFVPITINAKWGFEDVPEDVKEAVLELTIMIWRSKDPAFAKVIRLEDKEIISQALPDRTKQIAARIAEERAQEVGI
ncbi:MAG: hypothetical protein AUG51_19340 [Acidobacteria bacterium 13_1_20CM_3_53_8]|nr:MAG: hypothetical protein AUG51_19340 [Acidobacteria bacterium 13_1_20CM_3_53_8]